jgi:hypothetical protein
MSLSAFDWKHPDYEPGIVWNLKAPKAPCQTSETAFKPKNIVTKRFPLETATNKPGQFVAEPKGTAERSRAKVMKGRMA